jgi:molecular chaperone GrpE
MNLQEILKITQKTFDSTLSILDKSAVLENFLLKAKVANINLPDDVNILDIIGTNNYSKYNAVYQIKLNEPIAIAGMSLYKINLTHGNSEDNNIEFACNELEKLLAHLKNQNFEVSEFENQFIAQIDSQTISFSQAKLVSKSESNEQIEKLNDQIQQEINSRLLLMADFKNYKKRIEVEKEQFGLIANKIVFTKLIEAIADFDRAISYCENLEVKSYEELLKGNMQVIEKLNKILEESGISDLQIKIGDKFDPATMDAITTLAVEEEQKDNTVVDVIEKGYKNTISDQIYQTAKVVIGKFNKQ